MRRWLLILACGPAALAQYDSNVLTVTAARTQNLQPDQASLLVSVGTGVSAALSDVLAALQPANVTAANFTSVYTNYYEDSSGNEAPEWDWNFTVTVPIAGLKGTLTSLASVQQSISAARVNPMAMAYYVQYASYSFQLLAANPCPYAAVFSDAQTQAQSVASAAGMTLGPVVTLNDGSGTVTNPATVYATVQGGVYLALISAANYVYVPPAPSCTMVVQFQLVQ